MSTANHTEVQNITAAHLGSNSSVIEMLLRLRRQITGNLGQTTVIDATLAAAMGPTTCPEQFKARLQQIQAALG